jgi:glutathione S-transferase
MKLYYAPGACSLAAHIVAEEEELPLELERVNLKTHRTEHGEDFYDINPKGYVPALEFDDGEVLTENVAILPCLADLVPNAGLAPPAESFARLRLLEWLGFLSAELHHAFAPFFHGNDESRKTEAREVIRRRLSYVADELSGRDYLMGEALSVADPYLFVMLRWCDLAGIELGEFTVLDRYRTRMLSRAAVQAAMKAEGLPRARPAAVRRSA